ncbi:MAG: DUF305 domain-containing protein [Usitatibacter sp.]
MTSSIHRRGRVLLAALFGLSLLAANAQDKGMQGKSMPMDCSQMHESMMGGKKGMDGMRMSGDVDRDFATMMKMHHQGALPMAQAELDKGKDSELRDLARKIIDAQKTEIAQLDRWLAKKGK